MAVDMKKARERLEAAKKRMAGGLWRPKSGKKNKVRIVPWKLPSGEEVIEIEEAVHFMGKGPPEVCAGEGCLLCQEAAQLMDSDDAKEKEQGKRIRAQVKFNLQVLDRLEAEPTKLHRWPAPSTAYVGIMSVVCEEEEYPDALDLEKGRDFIIEFDKEAKPQDMYKVIPAGSPSSVDVSGLKLAPYPPSVKGEQSGDAEGAPRGKRKEAASADDGRGGVPADAHQEEEAPGGAEKAGGGEEGAEYACFGEFDPKSGYCKKCEARKACKAKS